MTQQAVQLGWLPAIQIRHTSADAYGQIYVPLVNWTMMILTVALILGFTTANRLAGAYGAAVSVTMVLTTLLLYTGMRKRWYPTSIVKPALLTGAFLIVDLAFLAACLLKIGDGAWIPLAIGGLVFVAMVTWHSGASDLHRRNDRRSRAPAQFFGALDSGKVLRAPGTAIFLTRLTENIPPIVVEYVRRTGSLQKSVILLSVDFDRVPRVAPADKVKVVSLARCFWRISVRFGFFEDPDLPSVLLNELQHSEPCVSDATYFIERHDVVSRRCHAFPFRLRTNLFAIMLRNSSHVIDRFKVPSEALFEVGRRIEL